MNALLIDFGSTYTKLTAVDLSVPRVMARAQAPSTAATDLREGLERGLEDLRGELGRLPRWHHRLACSSAAGGLRMVAIGLVPSLTAEAARRAALGAGARVIGAFAYRIGTQELEEIAALQPDMILLAGGTDGGNRDILMDNARSLAEAAIDVPVVVAGNRDVAGEAGRVLGRRGRDARVAANVMPRLMELNVEPAREVIRALFMERIVAAKGLTRAAASLDGVLMPTPAAVLQAARLLADGTEGVEGLGPLVVVDVGGATTDVHSIGCGRPTEPGVRLTGLEEPYAKRTVEGDLGTRHSAPGLLAVVGEERLRAAAAPWEGDLEVAVAALAHRPDWIPEDEAGTHLDEALTRLAVGEALRRHAGRVREVPAPTGTLRLQEGKDLRGVRALIGTGGVFRVSRRRSSLFTDTVFRAVSGGVRGDVGVPLVPAEPELRVDAGYVMAAMGLLAEVEPAAALRIMKSSLVAVGRGGGDAA